MVNNDSFIEDAENHIVEGLRVSKSDYVGSLLYSGDPHIRDNC